MTKITLTLFGSPKEWYLEREYPFMEPFGPFDSVEFAESWADNRGYEVTDIDSSRIKNRV